MHATPIGYVKSVFKEKFGIPRQPGLVPAARAVIELNNDPDLRLALRGLEGFSHLWVIFWFHEHGLNTSARQWKPSIRPPRLGGQAKVGVLASRSPHRPNPIGLSAVRLEGIDLGTPSTHGPRIEISGHDLLDGTPVFDLKPYVPYCDALPEARSGWADEAIPRIRVEWSEDARKQAHATGDAELEALATQILALDPRPAFQKRDLAPHLPEALGTRYGFMLKSWDIRWVITAEGFRVEAIVPLSEA